MLKMDLKMFFILQITIAAVCPSFLMSSLFTANEISSAVMDGVDDKKMNEINGDMESKPYWNKFVENLSLRNLKNVDNFLENTSDMPDITSEEQKKHFVELARRRVMARKLKKKRLNKRRKVMWFNDSPKSKEKRSVEDQSYSAEPEDETNNYPFIPTGLHHHHHHHHHYFIPREDQEEEMRNKQSTLIWYYWWYKTFFPDKSKNSTTLTPHTMMPLSKIFFHDSTTLAPQTLIPLSTIFFHNSTTLAPQTLIPLS